MKTRLGGLTGAAVALAVALGISLSTASGATGRPAHPGHGDRVVYDGSGEEVWRQSGQLDRLHETPRSFRRFVSHQLDHMWREYTDRDPACTQASLVMVKEYRRRVAFIANQGTFAGGPGDAPDSCATGGAFRFYVKRDGHWRAPLQLGGQDVLACSVFRRWDIPRMSGAHQCFRGGEVVRWDP
jgi:hypothetical protein